MDDDEILTNKQIMFLLDSILQRLTSMEERINCIQHTLCKNNDDKTHEAIGKFVNSNFRNYK